MVKGGNWITGRKLNFNHRYLYIIIENYQSINELYVVYDYIIHDDDDDDDLNDTDDDNYFYDDDDDDDVIVDDCDDDDDFININDK